MNLTRYDGIGVGHRVGRGLVPRPVVGSDADHHDMEVAGGNHRGRHEGETIAVWPPPLPTGCTPRSSPPGEMAAALSNHPSRVQRMPWDHCGVRRLVPWLLLGVLGLVTGLGLGLGLAFGGAESGQSVTSGPLSVVPTWQPPDVEDRWARHHVARVLAA